MAVPTGAVSVSIGAGTGSVVDVVTSSTGFSGNLIVGSAPAGGTAPLANFVHSGTSLFEVWLCLSHIHGWNLQVLQLYFPLL